MHDRTPLQRRFARRPAGRVAGHRAGPGTGHARPGHDRRPVGPAAGCRRSTLLADLGVQVGVIAAAAGRRRVHLRRRRRALGASGDPGSRSCSTKSSPCRSCFSACPPLTWHAARRRLPAVPVCDIWKPGLAREAEKLPGGWGIVADDCVAAVLACAAAARRASGSIARRASTGWRGADAVRLCIAHVAGISRRVLRRLVAATRLSL